MPPAESPLKQSLHPVSMRIGSLRLSNPLILAPMVRVTDLPFRVLCREQGASLAFCEMLYARALTSKAPRVLESIRGTEQDQPFGVQLAAFDPQTLAEAVKIASETADVLDLNLGCPVPKAEKSGVGAVLLEKPDKIVSLVKAMRKATEKPITVKMRLLENRLASIQLAKSIQEAGADAVTVHGRTKEQRHAGAVDFETIAQIKEAVSIPIVNNGGIVDRASLEEIRKKTNCDGFMLARSAIGNPGIFAQLQGKKGISKLDGLKRYLELCTELSFSNFGRIKQQSLRFAHAMNDLGLHRKIEKSRSIAEITTLIN